MNATRPSIEPPFRQAVSTGSRPRACRGAQGTEPVEVLEPRIAPANLANIGLSSLNGSNGFKLSGVADNDRSGYSVSTAGDVNGDGFADLIIGAYKADETGTDRGASYVVFGKA